MYSVLVYLNYFITLRLVIRQQCSAIYESINKLTIFYYYLIKCINLCKPDKNLKKKTYISNTGQIYLKIIA